MGTHLTMYMSTGLTHRSWYNLVCYDRGGFLWDTLDCVHKYGANAQELVTTSSTRLLVAT